ncbi:TlpA family protein disulfide reductase [candidate division KSB1 bacterium]|nr:TlpA family protein disulfide reductase [candidate division KSB1 bacterium]
MKTKALFIIPILFALSLETEAVNPTRGILNQKAPSWEVSAWFQLPEDKKSLDVADFKDKVIYLYCFQSWCPGCHKYGFPTLKKVIKQYKNDKDVAIVAVQTTFEGFSSNGIEQAKEVAKKYQLNIPIGQSGTRGHRSKLMASYRTGGTPWTIIIDKQGVVRYNDFHIYPNDAAKLIEHLKQT